MHIRAKQADELLHIHHIIVKMEWPLVKWNIAGILPVGDVNLMVTQHGAYRIAQQRRKMPRQRRDNQHLRLIHYSRFHKAQQAAKRLVRCHLLIYRHFAFSDDHGIDTELRLPVALREAKHELKSGSVLVAARHISEWTERICVRVSTELGENSPRLKKSSLELVKRIEHRNPK